MNQSEYIQLVARLNEYSKLYHESNTSPISDEEYDQLYAQLRAYEESHPNEIVTDSPSQRVGETPAGVLGKIKHVVRMYSLENAFNYDDMLRYLKRFDKIRKQFGSERVDQYYVDYKMDGLSCELVYNNGRLVRCVTRGDGDIGEDVTANAMTIPNIPHVIRYNQQLIVRGEVVVHKEDFNLCNMARKRQKLPLFSNCRNYAAGSLRQKNPEITRERHLKFYAWELIVPSAKKLLHHESIQVLTRLGFSVPKGSLCHSIKEIASAINHIQQSRNSLSFDIDGAVIKLNDPEFYKTIGWNNHAPLFNIAYKFVAQEAQSEIKAINWGMGRSGKLTPVALIKPVNISGVVINNVTLNNPDYVENNQIGIGTTIKVIRSADVIPKISSIVKSEGFSGVPNKCPFCQHDLVRNGPELKCVNDHCREKLIMRLAYLVSKDCLNIKGYGEKFIREAVTSGTFNEFADIFRSGDTKSASITQDSLNNLITTARTIDLVDLLTVLGIPGCGRAVAFKLIQEEMHLPGIKRLFKDEQKLKNINIGNRVKENIRQWISQPDNEAFVDQLIALELPKC